MDSRDKEIATALRTAGLRATRQRILVLSMLMDAVDHPTADELFERIRELDGSVSYATLYRTLSALEHAAMVQKFSVDGDPARFELTPSSDHDHLIDLDTGEVIEFSSVEVSDLRRRLIAELGFEIVSQHTLVRVRKKL